MPGNWHALFGKGPTEKDSSQGYLAGGLLHSVRGRGKGPGNRHLAPGLLYRAVRLWMAAFATGAVAPKPRPGATAEDDRIALLTPEGAAYLAEQCEQAEAVAPTAYAKLYPTCRVQGCQDDPEPRSLDCYRHQLVDAF